MLARNIILSCYGKCSRGARDLAATMSQVRRQTEDDKHYHMHTHIATPVL